MQGRLTDPGQPVSILEESSDVRGIYLRFADICRVCRELGVMS